MTFKIWGPEDVTRTVSNVTVERPGITALPDGSYVVTWREANEKIGFQLYSGHGTKIGSAHFIDAASGGKIDAAVQAYGPDGSFTVTWAETGSSGTSMYAQRYDYSGQGLGGKVTVADAADGTVGTDIAMSANSQGGWADAYVQGPSVKLDQYNDLGGLALSTAVFSGSASSGADVAWLGGTKHVVSYINNSAVKFAVVDNGVVGTTNSQAGADAQVAGLEDTAGNPTGDYVLAVDKGPNSGITAYKYAGGNTTAISISTEGKPNDVNLMDVTALKGGRFAVTYIAADGGDFGNVFIKVVEADGSVGNAMKINALDAVDGIGSQKRPVISEMADGRLAVAWHDPTGSAGNGSNITTTIVDARTGGVNVSGTSHGDIYVGSDYTDDLSGNDGNDVLVGGGAADHLHGGAGIDTASFQYAAAGVVVDLKAGIGSGGEAAGDTYDGIENLLGSNLDDRLVGDDGANVIDGNGGNDVLIGGAGADALMGGAGLDTASYETAGAGVVVDLGSGHGTGGDAAGDTYNSIEILVGSSFNDSLTGDAAGNSIYGGDGADIINGAGGADVMVGGNGDDAYYVDNPGDQIVEAAGGGNDTVYAATNFALAPFVENLIAIGGGAVGLTGNDLNNTITGNEANNVINGGAGADTMSGGGGNDTYYVDNPGDVIVDSSGVDTVVVSGSISLTNIVGIENVVVSGPAASVTGNDESNILTGDGFANLLWGFGGNDTLLGLGDNDKLFGGNGNDIVKGGVGNDTLKGDAGNDQIWGEAGKDVLYGGAGKDIFVFSTSPNTKTNLDKIMDFNIKDDTIWLDNKVFAKLGKGSEAHPGKLNAQFFTIGDHAKDKNDYLIYDAKKGVLWYDADGSGSHKAVEIATLKKGLKMTFHDFLII